MGQPASSLCLPHSPNGVPDWQVAFLQGPRLLLSVALPTVEPWTPVLGVLALTDRVRTVHETALNMDPVAARICPYPAVQSWATQLVTLNRSKCGNTAWLCPQEGRGMRILASTGLCHREEPEWPVQSQNHLAVGLESAPEINTAL